MISYFLLWFTVTSIHHSVSDMEEIGLLLDYRVHCIWYKDAIDFPNSVIKYDTYHHDNHKTRPEQRPSILTHWGQVVHICVSKLIIIGPDNDLSPARRQVIIWTNAGVLIGTNFNEIVRAISFKKMYFENIICTIASILSLPQCVKEIPIAHFILLASHQAYWR